MTEITTRNGRTVITTTSTRLGNISNGIAADEAVNMSQLNSLTTRVTAIEEGTESLTIVEVDNGGVTAPSITFASDLNTGIYRIGADNLGITAGGTKIVDINTAGASVTGTFSASTTVTAGTLLLTGNGTVGAPSHSFTSDTDTGLYRIGADNIGIAANGTKIVDIATTGVAVTGLVSATTTVTAGTLLISGDGAVGAPAHTFTNDLDCGLYRIGANNIGFSAGGNKILDIGTSGLGITGSLSTTTYFLTGDGSVAAPGSLVMGLKFWILPPLDLLLLAHYQLPQQLPQLHCSFQGTVQLATQLTVLFLIRIVVFIGLALTI
jgi:hypothetical protein